jgi:selenocysteine-specific elongation factor
VAGDESLLWRAGFSVQFTLHQQQLVDYVLAGFAAAPYSPPNEVDVLRQLGNENELLEAMLEQTLLVRISGNVLFRHNDFAAMIDRVRAATQQQGSITLAQVRDLFDTSRKYAQAILEEMDARRITRREGDVRVLR